MNNPVVQQNPPIGNPQINLNLQINQNANPNEIQNNPVVEQLLIEPKTNLITTNDVIEPSLTTYKEEITTDYEEEYDTGHKFMDLQEELDFDNDDENDNQTPKFNKVVLCIYRIRKDLKTPFLEFFVQRTNENPYFHLPSFSTGDFDDFGEDTGFKNNLLQKIELLLSKTETLEIPKFLGFQTKEDTVFAFYDVSSYSGSLQGGDVLWVLLNQITNDNGFETDTLLFFENNVYIRTLYHTPTQEEIPPPVLVYHSFQIPTRVEDPVFGFPFIFTEKPLFSVENFLSNKENTETNPVEKEQEVDETEPNKENTETKPVEEKQDVLKTEKKANNFFSFMNPLSTENRSYPFILFPPPLDKTLVILKKEFQNIPQELLKKYNDVFLKKSCIRFLKNGVDYWIVKSPIVAFPYSTGSFEKKSETFSTGTKSVSFLPEKTTSSSFTPKKHPVSNDEMGLTSFQLNLKNLLNPHRITERANMIKYR